MNRDKFEKIVKEGIEAVPKKFLERLRNVDICIEEEPTPHQLRKIGAKKGSLIFGLYEGVPQTKRWYYGRVLPDKITIFKKAIEKAACFRTKRVLAKTGERQAIREKAIEEEVKRIVKNTVWHEIAHHFGMDEERVRAAEKNFKRK